MPTDDPVLLALDRCAAHYQIPVGLLDQLAYGTAADLEHGSQSRPRALPLVARYQTFEESAAVLLRRRLGGWPGLHQDLRLSRSRGRAAGGELRAGVPADEHYSRCERRCRHGPSLFPAGRSGAVRTFAAIWRRRNGSRIRPLLAIEADRARECYRAGEELIPLVNEDSQPALWVLITIYRRLLEKIAANDYDVFSGRVRLTVPEKLTRLGERNREASAVMPSSPGERFRVMIFSMQNSTVAIAGGGLAGLAAGCALADAGFRVTLFERRPLSWRTRIFVSASGDRRDCR